MRYEADVPVSLSSVLSAALPWRKRQQQQQQQQAGSPGAAAPIHRLSSSVGAMPQSALSTVTSQMSSPGRAAGLPPVGSPGSAVSPRSLGGVASERALSPGTSYPTSGPLPSSSSSYRIDAWDKADSSVHGSHVFDLGEAPAGWLVAGWLVVRVAAPGHCLVAAPASLLSCSCQALPPAHAAGPWSVPSAVRSLRPPRPALLLPPLT